MDLNKHAGRMVKAGRLRQGWSQARLAEELKTTRQHVSGLEKASAHAPTLTVDLVRRLAAVLDIFPEALSHSCADLMRVLRGRIDTHFLHLGHWHRLAEVVFHVLHDLHRMRPDIVGMSVLLHATPHANPRAYNAAVEARMYGEAPVQRDSARVELSEKLREQFTRWDGGWKSGPRNILAVEEAQIPGVTLATDTLEYATQIGTIWLALSMPPRDDDEHLDRLMTHLAAGILEGIGLIRERGDRMAADRDNAGLKAQLQDLQDRVSALERM